MAKLTEVKETKGTKKTSKSKIDVSKIKKMIDDNPEAVNKIKSGVTEIIASNVLGKSTSKKTTKKKTSKSSDSDSLSKMMDLAGTFLGKK